MQIKVRPGPEHNGYLIDHICKSPAEYIFLQECLKDYPRVELSEETLTITTHVIA